MDSARPKSAVGEYLRVVLVTVPIVTVLFVFTFEGLDHLGRRIAVNLTIGATCASVCFWGVRGIAAVEAAVRRRKGLAPSSHSRIWYYALAVLLMPPGLYAGFLVLTVVGPPFGVAFHMPDLRDYRGGIGIGMTAAALFFLYEVKTEARQNLILQERQRLEAQLAALTARLNPHFLFNSLNTIAALIPTEPAVAEDMAVELADLYRLFLTAMKRDQHPLEDELALCRSYLEIERRRFGVRLRFDVDADDRSTTVSVPTLILQPLLENALKHAVSQNRAGGAIRISAEVAGDTLHLVVEDDGPGPDTQNPKGTGSGLETCRGRLALLYGEAAALILAERPEGGTRASLSIPVRST